MQVKDSDSRLLSLVRNSSIALVGTDSLKEEGEGDGYRATETKEKGVKERGIHVNIQSCRDEFSGQCSNTKCTLKASDSSKTLQADY